MVYVTTSHVGVWKTPDGGESWTELSNGIRGLTIYDVAVDAQRPEVLFVAAGHGELGEDPGGIYKSEDGGASWVHVSGAMPGATGRAVRVNPVDSNIVYAAVTSGVYVSTDGGASWAGLRTGLPPVHFEDLEIDPENPNRVYVGTTNGVFSITLDEFPGDTAVADDVDHNRGALPIGNIPRPELSESFQLSHNHSIQTQSLWRNHAGNLCSDRATREEVRVRNAGFWHIH